MINILLPAIWETIYMSVVSTSIAVIIGFFTAIVLILTQKDGLMENIQLYIEF